MIPGAEHDKWLNQAQRDLAAAAVLLDSKHYEWSCFVCLQAAEKAIKACMTAMEIEWMDKGRVGHDLAKLQELWPNFLRADDPQLANAVTQLNRMSEDTRYPHEPPDASGKKLPLAAPHEVFREVDAKASLESAKQLVDFYDDFIKNKLPKLEAVVRSFGAPAPITAPP